MLVHKEPRIEYSCCFFGGFFTPDNLSHLLYALNCFFSNRVKALSIAASWTLSSSFHTFSWDIHPLFRLNKRNDNKYEVVRFYYSKMKFNYRLFVFVIWLLQVELLLLETSASLSRLQIEWVHYGRKITYTHNCLWCSLSAPRCTSCSILQVLLTTPTLHHKLYSYLAQCITKAQQLRCNTIEYSNTK